MSYGNTMTFILNLGLDMVKMYHNTKMKFLHQLIQSSYCLFVIGQLFLTYSIPSFIPLFIHCLPYWSLVAYPSFIYYLPILYWLLTYYLSIFYLLSTYCISTIYLLSTYCLPITYQLCTPFYCLYIVKH